MNNCKEQEDIYIEKIFSIFTQCRSEQSTDRRQVYFGQLCGQIFKWCNLKNIEDMGEEICIVCKRILKEESKANIPKEKTEFIKYIYTALKTEKANYHRTYESGIIKIPKERKSKLKEIENVLKMEESNLGRKLTFDEQTQFLYKWFKFNKEDYQKYVDLLSKKYVGSISVNDDDKPDLLNMTENAYYDNNINDNKDDNLFSQNIKILCEAVKSVLDKKQMRARDCYKALFTLYCIDNHSDIVELEGLSSVLDIDLLEAYRKAIKKPTQREIYQKYHSDIKDKGAEARASELLRIFLADLRQYLKVKKP